MLVMSTGMLLMHVVGTGGLLMHVVTTTVLLGGRPLSRVRGWMVGTTGLGLAMIVNGVVRAVWVGVGGFCDRSSSARWSGYRPPSIDAVEISGIVIKMNVWTWLEPAQEPTPAPDDK